MNKLEKVIAIYNIIITFLICFQMVLKEDLFYAFLLAISIGNLINGFRWRER